MFRQTMLETYKLERQVRTSECTLTLDQQIYGWLRKTAKILAAVAGLAVKRQRLGLATNSNFLLAITGVDGVLGLGQKAASFNGGLPLFYNMVDQDVLSNPVFTFCRSRQKDKVKNNQLIFGDSDPSRYPGKAFTFVPVQGSYFWQFKLDKISVDGDDSACGTSCCGIADSGTTLIRGPKSIIESINDLIGATLSNSYYLVDCDTTKSPSIDFEIEGETFTMEPEDYIISVNSTNCITVFAATNAKSTNCLILGIPFLNGKCTQFDLENKRIGLVATTSE
ncbi:hypothetical protein C0J52_00364 [Blattella germanica]|nr:hypothetical protein C0J52_00364 [Blattella germanica]